MSGLLQSVVNGLLLGGIYGVVAVGLNLIRGVMGIVNFAHGACLMVSMYASFFAYKLLGLSPLASLPLVAVFMFVFGYLIQAILIDKTIGEELITQLGVTFGLMLFLENLALIIFSPNWRSIDLPFSTSSLQIGNIFVSTPRFISFIGTMLIAVGVYFLLTKTKLGTAIRATAQNDEAAAVLGIDITKIYRITFGLGLAITGIAGGFIMTFQFVYPTIGINFALIAYVVIVLGGLGNIKGCVLGGLIVGLSQSLGAFFIGSAFKDTVLFIIFMIVLVVKPKGIFGEEGL